MTRPFLTVMLFLAAATITACDSTKIAEVLRVLGTTSAPTSTPAPAAPAGSITMQLAGGGYLFHQRVTSPPPSGNRASPAFRTRVTMANNRVEVPAEFVPVAIFRVLPELECNLSLGRCTRLPAPVGPATLPYPDIRDLQLPGARRSVELPAGPGEVEYLFVREQQRLPRGVLADTSEPVTALLLAGATEARLVGSGNGPDTFLVSALKVEYVDEAPGPGDGDIPPTPECCLPPQFVFSAARIIGGTLRVRVFVSAVDVHVVPRAFDPAAGYGRGFLTASLLPPPPLDPRPPGEDGGVEGGSGAGDPRPPMITVRPPR